MKKILSLLAIMLLAIAATFGQAPPGIFNYQGVARNSVGNALVNKTITLRLTIRDGAAAGPLVYQESRTVTTNPFGLFNVQVGSGGTLTQIGTITGVTWSVNTKFIQVEIDPNGGTTFINIGTAQIASVPYAFHSASSNDLILPFNKTQADNGTLFKITNSGNNSGSTALEGLTNSVQANAAAIIGTVTNTSPGSFSTGVKGINNGTGGLGIGVWGSQNGSGYGVYGTTPAGWAVRGEASTTGVGVHGQSSAGIGVFGTSNTGNAGRFDNTNAANTADALVANTNGAASSWALRATSTGLQGAGIFTYNNAAGTANALRVTNNGSGAAVSATGSGTGSAGVFTNTNAANNASTVAITTNGTVATALSVSGPGIWGSAIGITNTTSGMEWRTSVNGTTYTVTKIPGATFSPFQLFDDGQVEFASTTGATRLRILNDGTVGINTASPVNTSKVHINGTGTAGSILTRTSLFTGGNLDGANGHGLIADGEWRAVWGRNLGTGGRIEATGLRGEAGGSGYTNGTGVFATAIGSGSLNMGAFGNASGSATANFGIRGQANGATAGQNWGSFAFAGTSSSQNVAVGGQAAVNPNSWAGAFFGRVAIIDGTEAANRVFTSDAGGNGSWQPLVALGGVTGSGTLNFIPKWTPNGTTLGNSLMFDNGAAIGLGTTTPTHRLEVNHGGATGIAVRSTASFSVLDIDASSGDAAIRLQNAGVSQWNIRNRPGDNYLEIFEMGGGGSRVVIQDGTGNVGIGQTVSPSYKLDVLHGGATGVHVQSSASFSVVDIDAFSGDAALRFQSAGVGQWNTRNRPVAPSGSTNDYQIFELGGGGSRLVIQDGTGWVGIGGAGALGTPTDAPEYQLDVLNGGATGIRSKSSASFSVVDIDAASGDAALRFQRAGAGRWNTRNEPVNDDYQWFELGGGGERMRIQRGSGNIGINQPAPSYKLDVLHGGATGLRVQSSASFSVIDIDAVSGDAALRFIKAGVNKWNTRNEPVNDDYQWFELGGGGERMRIQRGSGNIGINQSAPSYKLDVLHGGATGLRVQSSASFSVVDIDGSSGDAALRFIRAGVNQWNTRNNPATDDYQIFELGGGGERMRIENTTGNVVISQDLTVLGTKLFTMDHPLDPANKLLRHAAAESNEVINFYSGNVVTDASGKAVVKLPDYYEALNKDSRYQLTVIGSFAQAIISKEVSNNQFEIATSQPNIKVSWEVKGVRNDARMQQHPFVAELEKKGDAKGKYWDPAAHNQPASMSVSYDASAQTSLEHVAPAVSKAATVSSGGSLDQQAIVAPATNVQDTKGSVEDIAPAKPVAKAIDQTGSIEEVVPVKATGGTVDKGGSIEDVQPAKPARKSVDKSGSVENGGPAKPIPGKAEEKSVVPSSVVKDKATQEAGSVIVPVPPAAPVETSSPASNNSSNGQPDKPAPVPAKQGQ